MFYSYYGFQNFRKGSKLCLKHIFGDSHYWLLNIFPFFIIFARQLRWKREHLFWRFYSGLCYLLLRSVWNLSTTFPWKLKQNWENIYFYIFFSFLQNLRLKTKTSLKKKKKKKLLGFILFLCQTFYHRYKIIRFLLNEESIWKQNLSDNLFDNRKL